MKLVLLILVVAGLSQTVLPQEKISFNSNWKSLDVDKKLSDKWAVSAEVHARNTFFLKDWQQVVVRPHLHYLPEKNINISVGYSYIKNYQFSDFSTPVDAVEHNVFQQVIVKHEVSKIDIHHRVRFEERFQPVIIKTPEGSHASNRRNYSSRFRYRIQVAVPLEKVIPNHDLKFVAFDEAHLDFGKSLLPESFDQKRWFMGVSFRASDKIKIRSGYQNIYLHRSTTNFYNHIWDTSITYSL
jgi:hypothetical protein